jgi:hypothetical protein
MDGVLDLVFNFSDAVCFIPMNLRVEYSTTREPHVSEPLFLFPATVTVDTFEPREFTNAGALGNHFDVGNFPDDIL